MAIKSIRLPDQTVVEIDEWLQWPAYSTFEASQNAALNIRLFGYVLGQRVPQSGAVAGGRRDATATDTNWQARSRVNNDEAFIFYSMTYEHFSLENSENYVNPPTDIQATTPIFTGTNLRVLQQFVRLKMIVGADIEKPQANAPLSYYGQGLGAPAYGSGDSLVIAQGGGATALQLNYGTGGSVSPRNQRQWALPIYIHSDRVFRVELDSPRGPMDLLDQDYRLRVTCDGLKRRPVA